MKQNESNQSRVLRKYPNAKCEKQAKNLYLVTFGSGTALQPSSGTSEREAWRHARRQIDRAEDKSLTEACEELAAAITA